MVTGGRLGDARGQQGHDKAGSEADQGFEGLTLEDLRRYCDKFDSDALRCLSPEASLRSRDLPGGPSPQTVRRRLGKLRNRERLS